MKVSYHESYYKEDLDIVTYIFAGLHEIKCLEVDSNRDKALADLIVDICYSVMFHSMH